MCIAIALTATIPLILDVHQYHHKGCNLNMMKLTQASIVNSATCLLLNSVKLLKDLTYSILFFIDLLNFIVKEVLKNSLNMYIYKFSLNNLSILVNYLLLSVTSLIILRS